MKKSKEIWKMKTRRRHCTPKTMYDKNVSLPNDLIKKRQIKILLQKFQVITYLSIEKFWRKI